MQKVKDIFYAALVTIVCCSLGLSGCDKDEGASLSQEQNVLMQLSVNSRAVTEPDGTPTAEESALHTLRVYAFVGGKLVGHYFRDNIEAVPVTFLMDMTLYSETVQTVDFYVVANEAAMETPGSSRPLTERTSEAALNRFSFTHLETANGLPMFCHEQVQVDMTVDPDNNPQTQPGHEGHMMIAQKVSLSLQRPVAKLGVFAAKSAGESGTLRITGLTLLKDGMINYLMPQDESTLQTVGRETSQTLDVVTDAVTHELAADITPEDRKNPANYTPVLATPFYPFENPFGSNNWNTLGDDKGGVLQIDFEFDGVSRSGQVYLPPIERNHYYTICCLMNNSGKITIEYLVADWDDAPLWDDIMFAYPTYDNPVQPLDGQTMQKPTIYYNPDAGSAAGTFSVKFTMSEPAGQSWRPTLLNVSPADFEVKVFQGGQEIADPVATSEPYIVTVRALNPSNVGKVCSLGISYMPIWDPGKSELLLINGTSVSDIAWPDSGTSPEIIDITQIETPIP